MKSLLRMDVGMTVVVRLFHIWRAYNCHLFGDNTNLALLLPFLKNLSQNALKSYMAIYLTQKHNHTLGHPLFFLINVSQPK